MIIKNNKGFTLNEIVLTIGLIAILLAVATPQISTAYIRYQYTNSIRSIRGAMVQARGRAIGNSTQTCVTFGIQGNRLTYSAFEDNGLGGGIAENGIRDGQEAIIVAPDFLYPGISINTDAANTTFRRNIQNFNNYFIEFNRMGFAMGAPGGNILLFDGILQIDPMPECTIGPFQIIVNVSGNIRAIDTSATPMTL